MVLVIAAILIVPHLIDINKYHGEIQAQLQKKLGRQVSLGEMKLSIFPLSFQVADPVVAEDKSFDTGRPFATAQNLAVSVRLLPLLHKEVDIKSLELDRPHIELVRNAQGEWNFATLGQEPKETPAHTAPSPAQQNPQPAEQNPQPESKKPAGELALAKLNISDGQLAITDLQKHQSRAVYDHIDLSVSNFAPNQEFSLKLAAHLPGQGKETVSLEGTGGPIRQADMLNTNFDGTLRLDQVSLSGVEKFLNSQALNGMEGRISGDAKVKNAEGKLASSGSIRLDDARIQNVNVGYPIALDYDVTDDLSNDVIQIHRGNLKLGSTPITIAGTVNSKPTPAQIDVKLTTTNAPIGEMARLASAFGGQEMSGSGSLSLDVKAQGPTSNLNLNGTGKVANASLKLASLNRPVEIHNTDLSFSQNSATLQNIAATVGQTNANGQVTLKNFAAPQVQFTLNADRVNVAELQQMMNAAPTPDRKAASRDFWRLVPEANAQSAKSGQPSMLDKMTGGGTLNVGTVQYDDLVLSDVHSNVSLNHGLIQLNPLTSQLYGGQESGSVSIDLRPAQPVYSANLKTDHVDANKLISSVSSIKQMLYGVLASNVNASFSSTSADSIARGLNGTVGINLTNGKLVNLDMLHELGSVAKFVGISNASKGFTTLTQLSGDFNVKNGVAQTNNLKAVIDGGTLAAAGLVNLADQTLNMHVTAVLAKSMSQQVGGTQIGGFMNTALANNQGELVIPVIVTGTFQHPQVAPDVEQVAQMKLKNLLPTSGNPGALTSGLVNAITAKNKGGLGGILGNLTGQQQQNQQQNNGAQGKNSGQQQPPPQNQNPLGNVLDKVLGNKKKQPPQ